MRSDNLIKKIEEASGKKKPTVKGKTKTIKTEEGTVELTISDAANLNWRYAAELARKAHKGDKKAQEELKKLENTGLLEVGI